MRELDSFASDQQQVWDVGKSWDAGDDRSLSHVSLHFRYLGRDWLGGTGTRRELLILRAPTSQVRAYRFLFNIGSPGSGRGVRVCALVNTIQIEKWKTE